MANWKLNPTTLTQAKQLFLDIRKGLGKKTDKVEVIIAPPMPYISELQKLSPAGRIKLGAQDVYHEEKGAFTGEVSLPMLRSVGVSHVIVGHSEKRAAGETDKEIYQNVQSVIKGKTTAVVCVGETKRDKEGSYFGIVESQLKSALKDLKPADLKYVTIAYEPVWAIGSGKTATAEDVQEMRLFIKKVLADKFNRVAAAKIPVLYGGSVNKQNAETLLTEGQADGFLVGGASLRATEFIGVVSAAV